MSISYPYEYGNYIIYDADIGLGLKKQFSLVLLLEDIVTGGAPIGRVIVSLEKTKKKPFKNLSGAFCFKGLADGSYTLEIDSENYKPVLQNILIDAGQNRSTQGSVKIATIQLTPKQSYPFSRVVTMHIQIVDKDNQPLEKVYIRSRLLHPACFFKSHYDRFLEEHSGIENILKKYIETIDAKVCIYPETISSEDKIQLKDAYDEIFMRSSQKMKGQVEFSYLEYVKFLKEKIMKVDFLSKYESDNGHKLCLRPEKISDDDHRKMPIEAFNELQRMSLQSMDKTACFTHKKYIKYLMKFFFEDRILTKYAKDIEGKIRYDLYEIATDDLKNISKEIIEGLQQKAEVNAITDKNGEGVLVFKKINKKSQKISVLIEKNRKSKKITFDLNEDTKNNLKMIFP